MLFLGLVRELKTLAALFLPVNSHLSFRHSLAIFLIAINLRLFIKLSS